MITFVYGKDLLFQIADAQQGYFTSSQAEECGFARTNFRGIYRLAGGA